ncbi:MAG: RidA family protein [Gemmatimonadales bacterium]|nr:RidA family protein [Gemmatimonadales bacterium]
MASISPIQVPGTARPGGHYSQAIVHNGLVYVAGQLPVDLATGKPLLGTVEEQTRRVLDNMDQILRTAGSGLQHIVQVTAYITKLDDWDAINATYASIMGAHRPARAIVPVPELHYGVALEVTCIASVAPARRRRTRGKTRAPARRSAPPTKAARKSGKSGRGAKSTSSRRPRAR